MSLSAAVRRSYRHFLPRSFFTPRKVVRQLYIPALFYFAGLQTGMYSYASPTQSEYITKSGVVIAFALLVISWWAGPIRSPEA